MTFGELEGRGGKEKADQPVLNPKDPETQINIQPFLVHVSAPLKVLTGRGLGQRTPSHVVRMDNQLVMKTCTDYPISRSLKRSHAYTKGDRDLL